jgi:hypothetical protein
MVQEVRKIVLSTDELITAYEAHRRMTPHFLPEGKIIGCHMSSNGTVTVTLAQSDGLPPTFVTFKGMDVVKPLIRFCLENNVILPRDGRKSLSVTEGGATLCVTLNLHVDMVDSFVPMRTVHMTALTEVMPDPASHETLAVVTA